MNKPEILAPAGSPEALLAAVRCGADAVYVGGTDYSARSSAANFDLAQLKEAVHLCHVHGVKLYLAVNTLLTDRELPAFSEYIRFAAECGVDACIVQDLGVLERIHRMFPDMPLHASTQMSIHSPEGALQAASLGCQRVVAAREMSAEDLQKLCQLPIEVEVFVHGALCMSVSGQCAFSAIVGGRSANRGRCAQACRLPWKTPDGRNPAALSLKDLSLVEHAAELRRMGVTSFKIEGRMKRPEYVAAAVTALRAALDGEEPDLETLRSVFSRSGFTDGYFTGKKQEMFGFRRKEDVLAAQKVLQELQQSYRKPRKTDRMDCSMQLRENSPALLTANDSCGNSVVITGEVPEKASRTPLTQAMLEKHLQKLGDTIFECGDIVLENPDGMIIPASQCNAMRREAVEALYEKRAAANTASYAVKPCPEEKVFSVIPEAEPELRLHVRTAEQLSCALQNPNILCVPLRLADSCTPMESIWLEAPRIIENEEKYSNQLAEYRNKGFLHLLCHNLADIRIGNKLGYQLHGGFGLNCTNAGTAQSLLSQGVQDVTGSFELHHAQLSALAERIPCGGYLYGRLPMMLLRLCPIRAQESCRKSGCYMTDRTGQHFPLICSGGYTELCNAKILWLADKLLRFRKLRYYDLYFTTESEAQMQSVLEAYRTGEGTVPDDRTNGLYFKGGLS